MTSRIPLQSRVAAIASQAQYPEQKAQPSVSPQLVLQKARMTHGAGMSVSEMRILQRSVGNRAVRHLVNGRVTAKRTGLPEELKASVEQLSGLDLSAVRVHYNSSKPQQFQALAYTQGTAIHVAPGQEQHLPHETWHLVQQAQGRVLPTMQTKDGAKVNDDQGLEHEADRMGRKAVTTAGQLHDKTEEAKRLQEGFPSVHPTEQTQGTPHPRSFLSTTTPVIQRLLMNLGNDYAQNENARRLKESNPIEFRDGDLWTLVGGEALHLLAHSGGNKFAGYTPEGLFHFLLDGFLPDYVTAIQLHGCESKVFASELETLMNAGSDEREWVPKNTIKVRGIAGYSVISSTGRNFSIGREKGNDEVWNKIRDTVNDEPSNELLKGFKATYGEEIRKIKRLRSRPEIKIQLYKQVLQSLAQEVKQINIDAFGKEELISLGKKVDQIISIMHLQVSPVGDINHLGLRKSKYVIQKKLEALLGSEPEEKIDFSMFDERPWDTGADTPATQGDAQLTDEASIGVPNLTPALTPVVDEERGFDFSVYLNGDTAAEKFSAPEDDKYAGEEDMGKLGRALEEFTEEFDD